MGFKGGHIRGVNDLLPRNGPDRFPPDILLSGCFTVNRSLLGDSQGKRRRTERSSDSFCSTTEFTSWDSVMNAYYEDWRCEFFSTPERISQELKVVIKVTVRKREMQQLFLWKLIATYSHPTRRSLAMGADLWKCHLPADSWLLIRVQMWEGLFHSIIYCRRSITKKFISSSSFTLIVSL